MFGNWYMSKLFLLIIGIFLSISCFSQTYWRIEVEGGEELLLTMINNPQNLTFEAYTRKDALKDLAGTFTYLLAKTAGMVKFPEIVHCFGKYSIKSDTTYYSGSFDYLDKSFSLNVKTSKNSFYGKIVDNKNKIHYLVGEKILSDKPLKNYPSMIYNTFSLTEKFYYDRSLNLAPEWQNFKEKVNLLRNKIADDWELAANFYWYGKKLPITKYEIQKTPFINDPVVKKTYSPRDFNGKTCLLDLSKLPDENSEMEQLFKEILSKKYANLIIDARGRKNFQLSSAKLLADHLTIHSGIWSVVVTRKWTDVNSSLPKPNEFDKLFKNYSPIQYKINQIYQEQGIYLKTEPALSVFNGKVYMLINSGTSTVSEAMGIWLKNDKIATLVGQKSAGLPLLTELIPIEKQYNLILQTAQLYDKEGKSYLNSGIEPDINVSEGDALKFLLKKIN